MVYCNYIRNSESSVTYAYGATVEDITGELVFDFKNDMIEINKDPEKGSVIPNHIKRLYGKYKKSFKNGLYPRKIAYEI